MKKYIISYLGFSLFALSIIYLSCNKKALDISSPTASEANYFQNENEYRTAILGAYASLTDYYSAGGSAQLIAWYLPGDDMTVGNDNSLEVFKGLNSGDGALNQVWSSSYKMIGRANKVLERIAIAENVFTTPNLKNSITGEAYFLRAFAHFHLWNLFGTAPVVIAIPKSTEQLYAPSSKGTELLDQAIADLTLASGLLPSSWSSGDLGRATANSANGLLGKVLVYRASANKSVADYQAAIVAFNKISGLSLNSNFEDNFDVTKENNNESVFEFQAGPNITGNGQNGWLSNDQCDCGVSGAYYQMFEDGAGTYMGGGRYSATVKLQNSFNSADPRLPYTLTADKQNFVKYVRDGGGTDGAIVSRNNNRILRYADVLLLEAEAILQSGGGTTEAIGLINQIRARARNMVPGGVEPADLLLAETDKKIIMQWIMDERFRELAGEGHRWFDLRRWHMAGYITLNNAFFSSLSAGNMDFKITNLLFPIPNNEIDVNKNIVPNPGY